MYRDKNERDAVLFAVSFTGPKLTSKCIFRHAIHYGKNLTEDELIDKRRILSDFFALYYAPRLFKRY